MENAISSFTTSFHGFSGKQRLIIPEIGGRINKQHKNLPQNDTYRVSCTFVFASMCACHLYHGTLAAPETILLLANNDYNRSIGRRNILGLMG